MKKLPTKYQLSFILILLIATAVYASDIVRNFNAYPMQNKVVLTWETTTEENLEKFQVERSHDGKAFYPFRPFIYAKHDPSDNEYRFVDETVFAKSPAGDEYTYRLKIIFDDGSYEYSQGEPVRPQISSTRQTWGSIKALFK